MTEYSTWLEILNYYEKRFGYPREVTDIIACLPILSSCCMGYSNYRIANRTRTSTVYVASVNKMYLDFLGWNLDLDFSPIAVYNSYNVNKDKFAYELEVSLSYTQNQGLINLTYGLCKKLDALKEKVKYYEQ